MLFCIQVQIVSAGTWIENFNGENLDSWIEHDEHFETGERAPKTIWQTKNGRLDVWIDPPPTPGIFERFPLEFTGFPVNAKELNVKVEILESSRDSIGIIMGQYTVRGTVMGLTFHFLSRSTIPLNNTPFKNGVIQTPVVFDIEQIANQVDSEHLPLDELEISFNNGHFMFMSGDILLTEFNVPQLTNINCIGLIAYVERGAGHIGTFMLDNFVISGPNVPNHGSLNVRPKGKAAVLWGELKRQ